MLLFCEGLLEVLGGVWGVLEGRIIIEDMVKGV